MCELCPTAHMGLCGDRPPAASNMRSLVNGLCQGSRKFSMLARCAHCQWAHPLLCRPKRQVAAGYGEMLGRPAEGKQALAECCEVFDALWDDPQSRPALHRVAVRLLRPGSHLRMLVGVYLADDVELKARCA